MSLFFSSREKLICRTRSVCMYIGSLISRCDTFKSLCDTFILISISFFVVPLPAVPVGNSSVVFGVGLVFKSSSSFSGLYYCICGFGVSLAASAAAAAFLTSAACSVSYRASFRLLTMHTVIAIVRARSTITTQIIKIRSQFSWIHTVVSSGSSSNVVFSELLLLFD